MSTVSAIAPSILGFNVLARNDHPFSDGEPDRPGTDRRRRKRRKISGNRVLLLGKQRELALYRAEFLRQSGFQVSIPATLPDAIAEITRGAYDVAVLSYTLSSDEVQRMAELLRQTCPECPLVTISTVQREDLKVDPDETVLADEGPAGLMKVLQRLRRYQ